MLCNNGYIGRKKGTNHSLHLERQMDQIHNLEFSWSLGSCNSSQDMVHNVEDEDPKDLCGIILVLWGDAGVHFCHELFCFDEGACRLGHFFHQFPSLNPVSFIAFVCVTN